MCTESPLALWQMLNVNNQGQLGNPKLYIWDVKHVFRTFTQFLNFCIGSLGSLLMSTKVYYICFMLFSHESDSTITNVCLSVCHRNPSAFQNPAYLLLSLSLDLSDLWDLSHLVVFKVIHEKITGDQKKSQFKYCKYLSCSWLKVQTFKLILNLVTSLYICTCVTWLVEGYFTTSNSFQADIEGYN